MRQLLGGYAGRVNRLHPRAGHLFQNRHKSILCLQSQGYDFRYVLSRVAQLTGLQTEQILKPGKQPARVYARSLLCHWAIRRLGMAAVAVSKLRGISQSAATRAAYRGEAIAAADSLELVKKKNA